MHTEYGEAERDSAVDVFVLMRGSPQNVTLHTLSVGHARPRLPVMPSTPNAVGITP